MGSYSLIMISRLAARYASINFWWPKVITDKVLNNLLSSLINVLSVLVL